MGALLDSADRAKRQLDLEIADGRNAVNNMQVINGRDMTAKRGLEGSIHTIQAEVDARLLPSSLLLTNGPSLRVVYLTLKPLLPEEARLPWPSWPTHRHALENLLRLISVLNASARSSCSLPVRTRRTRIACPTLPLSSSLRSRLTSSRLRRPRRSLPSIWPSSERPSRSWKRPRREPSLLPSSKHRTSERAVKIRRKSVRGQQKPITTFTPE